MSESGVPASLPILQVHATRHCNLACAHCYSLSGPRAKGSIAAPLLDALFEDAFAEGYRIASLSGGEPLMDPEFRSQVQSARRNGFQVNIVTNGTLVDPPMAEWIAANVDLTAVSIDGPPDIHDRLRCSVGAFDKALAGIRALRSAGARVGVLHTARHASLSHLRWLVSMARDEGAELVQIHPLEDSGRASIDLQGEVSADLASRSALIVEILRRDFLAPALQVDVLPLRFLTASICDTEPDEEAYTLSGRVDPLVVEADGSVVPWTHGIDRRLQLGNINVARLAVLSAAYKEEGMHKALRHQRRVRDGLVAGPNWPYINWFGALAAVALDDDPAELIHFEAGLRRAHS